MNWENDAIESPELTHHSSEHRDGVPNPSPLDVSGSLPMDMALTGMDVASKNMTVPSVAGPDCAISPDQIMTPNVMIRVSNGSSFHMCGDQQGTLPSAFNTGTQGADLGAHGDQRIVGFSHSTGILQPSTSSGSSNAAKDAPLGLCTLADVATGAFDPSILSMDYSPQAPKSPSPSNPDENNVKQPAEQQRNVLRQLSSALAAGLEQRSAEEPLEAGLLRVLSTAVGLREHAARPTMNLSGSEGHSSAIEQSLSVQAPFCPQRTRQPTDTAPSTGSMDEHEDIITFSDLQEGLMALVKLACRQKGKRAGASCQSKEVPLEQGQRCTEPGCGKILSRHCDMR